MHIFYTLSSYSDTLAKKYHTPPVSAIKLFTLFRFRLGFMAQIPPYQRAISMSEQMYEREKKTQVATLSCWFS